MVRTPKLTDLQLVLLSTAASHDSGSLLPLPESVATAEPARLAKAIQALLKTGYTAESVGADRRPCIHLEQHGHLGGRKDAPDPECLLVWADTSAAPSPPSCVGR